MKKEKSKHLNVDLKTKEENFVLLSSKKHVYNLYVKEFDIYEIGHTYILDKLKTLNNKDTLNIHISSHGGDAKLLVEYANILQRTPAIVNGFLNFGHSCGALLFGVCANRYHYKYSVLMYHTYSCRVYGKSQEIKSAIDNYDKVLHKMAQEYYLGLTKPEFKKLKEGKDFWFDEYDMIQRNISKEV